MIGNSRLRRLATFGMMAVLALTLAACEQSHPNTTFTPHSEYGRAIDFLWDRLLLADLPSMAVRPGRNHLAALAPGRR